MGKGKPWEGGGEGEGEEGNVAGVLVGLVEREGGGSYWLGLLEGGRCVRVGVDCVEGEYLKGMVKESSWMCRTFAL